METIITIENRLGYDLPDEYRDFLLQGDMAQYRHKKYRRLVTDRYNTEGQIDRFSNVESFWKDNQYRDFLDEFQKERQIPRDYLESEFLYIIALCDSLAICMALNGNHKGKVYSSDNGDFGILFQTINLAEFLKSLY